MKKELIGVCLVASQVMFDVIIVAGYLGIFGIGDYEWEFDGLADMLQIIAFQVGVVLLNAIGVILIEDGHHQRMTGRR